MLPARVLTTPAAVTLRMRLLWRSATYTVPAPSTATPQGPTNFAASPAPSLNRPPARVLTVPSTTPTDGPIADRPFTRTTSGPVAANAGTVTVICVADALVTVPCARPNVTLSFAGVGSKPRPVSVRLSPGATRTADWPVTARPVCTRTNLPATASWPIAATGSWSPASVFFTKPTSVSKCATVSGEFAGGLYVSGVPMASEPMNGSYCKFSSAAPMAIAVVPESSCTFPGAAFVRLAQPSPVNEMSVRTRAAVRPGWLVPSPLMASST